MKEHFTHDRVFKDLFQMDRPTLLEHLSGGVPVREFLNVVFPKIIERRADLVALLEDNTLLHIEFQGKNDNQIVFREGLYGLLAWHQYKRPVRQVVLYLGEPKMRMNSELDTGGVKVSVRLIDIREIDADVFLKSGRPGDLALAMLAGGGTERLAEIARLAAVLNYPDRVRALTQLLLLSGLRKLSKRLKMEIENMGSIPIEIRENEFLREVWEEVMAEGKAEGIAEGKTKGLLMALQQLLQRKFGRVPKWANERVKKADMAQLEQWLSKVIGAESLEGVIGRR